MANIPTAKHGLLKPEYQDGRWDIPSNTNLDTIDNALPPLGGAIGQVLTKTSASNYDAAWADAAGGGGGGVLPLVIPEAIMTGNIYGGNITYDIWGGFVVDPVSCVADDGVTQLFSSLPLAGSFYTDTAPPNIFILMRTDGTIEVNWSVLSDGSDLVDTIAKRWLGFCPDGYEPPALVHNGAWMTFADNTLCRFPETINDAWASVDHSLKVPVDRIELIQYGTYYQFDPASLIVTNPIASNNAYESVIAQFPDSELDENFPDQWGVSNTQASTILPFKADRQFRTVDTGAEGGISVRAVKMKR